MVNEASSNTNVAEKAEWEKSMWGEQPNRIEKKNRKKMKDGKKCRKMEKNEERERERKKNENMKRSNRKMKKE